MKKTLIFLLIFTALISAVIAIELLPEIKIIEGKNNITTTSEFKPIYVSDFIKKYPEIEAISYDLNGEKGGYINHLGGIGEDFILRPTKQYEIFSSENISIQA